MGNRYIRVKGVRWFTNLDYGRRHQLLELMTRKDNLKFSKHKEIREFGYAKYDNYDAIAVAYSDSIPSDYEGIMGVSITFVDKLYADIYAKNKRGIFEYILGGCVDTQLLEIRMFDDATKNDAYANQTSIS